MFLGFLGTSEARWRSDLLNLTPTETSELASRFEVPVEVITAVAQAERDVALKNRYEGNPFDERTKALMRIILPSFVLRRIHT